MKLMLLTSDCDFATKAQDAGVDRIFLDLEYIGKRERQRGRNTVISENSIEDVARIRKVLTKSELLVRVNPIHLHSKEEIDRVILDGANIVMLPMVLDAEDTKDFVEMVNGRARTCLLLETSQSLVRLEEILEVAGVDEIYIGLNDMHISMQLDFMFEILSGGIVEYMASKIKAKGIPFGFGGIAKIGEGDLVAEKILAEHYRLGSESVILSRTFRNEIGSLTNEKIDLKVEIGKIRNVEKQLTDWSAEKFYENRRAVKDIVASIIKSKQYVRV